MSLLLLRALRAVVELALFSLIGQGAVGVLAGKGRLTNPFYRLFCWLTAPARALIRYLLPKDWRDSTISVISFVVLLILWLVLGWLKLRQQ